VKILNSVRKKRYKNDNNNTDPRQGINSGAATGPMIERIVINDTPKRVAGFPARP
jgi:hypothetical protein